MSQLALGPWRAIKPPGRSSAARRWHEDIMNNLTTKQLRGLFTTIEINLFIWLIVCGAIWKSPSVDDHIKHLTATGMIIAALLQHWAYYNLYRRIKKTEETTKVGLDS